MMVTAKHKTDNRSAHRNQRSANVPTDWVTAHDRPAGLAINAPMPIPRTRRRPPPPVRPEFVSNRKKPSNSHRVYQKNRPGLHRTSSIGRSSIVRDSLKRFVSSETYGLFNHISKGQTTRQHLPVRFRIPLDMLPNYTKTLRSLV